MRIGLHDADAEHLRNKIFPNYALMKISSWHKARGDSVEWWRSAKRFDCVYSSKIFDFTKENPLLPLHTVKGGTGYDVKSTLPTEIENSFPDYSVYPDCSYAVGFLTRGCINHCPWCIVPQKEGMIRPYRTWQELIRPDSDRLVLMDNNILASEHGIAQLERLTGSGLKIDLNQGMDIRLVTEELVQLFKHLNWIRFIRFSCDTKNQLPYFEKIVRLFEKHKISISRIFIYILVQKDLADADHRVQSLFALNRNISLYAQAERNEHMGIVPNRLQKEFAQRYVYGRIYKKENWAQYCARKGLIEYEQHKTGTY